MKSLIEVNPRDASIKSISFGNVRLTAYTTHSNYCLRVHSLFDGVHFSQTTEFAPNQLEHKVDFWTNGTPFVSLIDDDSGFDLTISDLDVYLAVCELLSMPVCETVVHVFDTEA